jgi:hypothetical protein
MAPALSFKYLISYLLEPVAYFLYLLAILFYLLKVGSSLRFKLIWVYYLIGTVILVKILFTLNNTNLYSLLYLITGMGFAFYFYELFHSRIKKRIALFAGLLTVLYYCIRNFLVGSEQALDSIGFVITSTGITILIFIYLNDLMANVKEESLTQNFDFWFICSQLMYHLGAFGIFLTYNHFTSKILGSAYYSDKNRDLLTYLWGVHNVLLLLGSLLTWSGLLWIVYRRRSMSS